MNEAQQKIVALLPMKANSSRVPGKNFRELVHKPLYKWILDTLLAVSEIDQIIINTDARSILEDSGLRESGRILIRDRAPGLCGDDVSMNLIIEDDMKAANADVFVMTHTTNPLLHSETVRDALKTYEAAVKAGDADSLFTVNKVQTRFYTKDGTPVNHDPDNLIPTQDLEPWFEENSNLYIFSCESFAKTNARIGASPVMFEMQPQESIDIDEPADWLFAEAMAKHQLSQTTGKK